MGHAGRVAVPAGYLHFSQLCGLGSLLPAQHDTTRPWVLFISCFHFLPARQALGARHGVIRTRPAPAKHGRHQAICSPTAHKAEGNRLFPTISQYRDCLPAMQQRALARSCPTTGDGEDVMRVTETKRTLLESRCPVCRCLAAIIPPRLDGASCDLWAFSAKEISSIGLFAKGRLFLGTDSTAVCIAECTAPHLPIYRQWSTTASQLLWHWVFNTCGWIDM